jgi:predicted O-methyltransferase YrrM
MNLSTKPEYASSIIDQLAQGFQKSHTLFAALKVGLFEALKEKKTAGELSGELGTASLLTEKLLKALASVGLIKKEGERYHNSELSDIYLTEESPFYQGNLINLRASGSDLWRTLDRKLAGKEEKRKAGRPGGAFNRDFIVAMAEGGMRGPLQRTAQAVKELEEFKNATALLDLGGGHGLYAIAFAEINPGLEATVFDLPPVIEVARKYIKKHGMASRVNTLGGNYAEDFPEGPFDIIFSSDNFYQPEEVLVPLVENIYGSLKSGGLLISKHWIDSGSPTSAFWDLQLSLMGFPHKLYKLEEYKRIFRDNNFTVTDSIDISTGPDPSVITVAKKEN